MKSLITIGYPILPIGFVHPKFYYNIVIKHTNFIQFYVFHCQLALSRAMKFGHHNFSAKMAKSHRCKNLLWGNHGGHIAAQQKRCRKVQSVQSNSISDEIPDYSNMIQDASIFLEAYFGGIDFFSVTVNDPLRFFGPGATRHAGPGTKRWSDGGGLREDLANRYFWLDSLVDVGQNGRPRGPQMLV